MLPSAQLTAVVAVVLSTALRVLSAATTKRIACPDGKHTTSQKECCAFYALRDDLQENLFGKECGDGAHKVLRLAFHDAIGYSQSGKLQGGGADGSLITFSDTELKYRANTGMDNSVNSLKSFLVRHSVSAGDLVQFAGAVGLSNCAGAPRLEFFAGRTNAVEAASDGMVSSPGDTVDQIVDRFADAGLSTEELVFLLASHSVARANNIDKTLARQPLDSTPSTFDSQFFLEILLKGKGFPGNGSGNPFESSSALYSEGELRLQSDYHLARDGRTACTWQSMINNQQLMMKGFKQAMGKLAVTGYDKSKLVDCSEVVPRRKSLSSGKERLVSAAYPPGHCFSDVEQACASPFPVLPSKYGNPSPISAYP